jgi:hypothetical protein
MSTVRVKKSVLQSIIRKSLSESDIKKSDVNRRLTVGPDSSSLPSELPLSPSDRMSTQLEVERPPVEDDEYVPMNPKELGLAVQALSEMVPVDHVEKAYMAFKRIIEQLEEEGSDDEEVQIESIRRKNAVLNALMREQSDEYKGVGKLMYQAYKGEDLGPSDDDEEEGASKSAGDSELEDLLREYPNALGNFGLVRSDIKKVIGLVDDILISGSDLETFMEILDGMEDVDDKKMQKVQDAFTKRKDRDLANFVKYFIRANTVAVGDSAKVSKSSKKSVEPASQSTVPASFEWQKYAKPMGYAAASGLRQSFIRDVTGVRALLAYLSGKDDRAYVRNSVMEAFIDGLSAPENQSVLKELIEEEGMSEFARAMEENPKLLTQTQIYKNFEGMITYEALSQIADMKFKGPSGKGFGRRIGEGFLAEFGEPKLSSREEMQLDEMQRDGVYRDLVDYILDEAEDNNYINLLTAAFIMAAEDADVEEYGNYLKPAYSTLKSLSAGKKPPELAVGEFLKGSPEGEEFASKIKAARRGRK